MTFLPGIAIATLLLALSAGTAHAVPKNPRVLHTLYDFEMHTNLHIDRAGLIALDARKRFKEYHDISPDLLTRFMARHDQSKVDQTIEFLKAHGIDHREETILEGLWKFAGEEKDSFVRIYGKEKGAKLQAELKQLMADLNRVDNEVAQEFFKRNGLLLPDGTPGPLARKLLRLEKLGDLIDRGSNAVTAEEMNKVMAPAHEWFQASAEKAESKLKSLPPGDPGMQQLRNDLREARTLSRQAREIEPHYSDIIGDLRLEKIQRSCFYSVLWQIFRRETPLSH